MPLSYRETGSPAVEPVILTTAKAQLNIPVTFTDDDVLITGLIIAARNHCEKIMNRSIFNRSMSYFLDQFPLPYLLGNHGVFKGVFTIFKAYNDLNTIYVPQPGLVSVTSITYLDCNMVVQTLDPSTYYVDINSEPGRIRPMQGGVWPIANLYASNVVTVSYVSGTWGDGVTINTCPQDVIQAMLLLISYWYTNRDSAVQSPPQAIAMGVDALLSKHKFMSNGW
jgi:hypothetical protein